MSDFWILNHAIPNHSPTQPHLADMLLVSRRINVATHLVGAALTDPDAQRALSRIELGHGRWLTIDRPLTPVELGRQTWRGRGRLHRSGLGLVRYARVELELSAWSEDASQLWIRPVASHPTRWGVRRLRRYIATATDAADHLWRSLTDLAQSRAVTRLDWVDDRQRERDDCPECPPLDRAA